MSGDQTFVSVWDALENSPTEAANMRLRSDLMIAVQQAVEGWNTTQAEAATRLGITQPRLNELIKGRISNFSLDALINIATKAGLGIRLEIERSAA
jgi:predicted XRE-type DNA-binding protein